MLISLPLLISSDHPLFPDVRAYLRANAGGRYLMSVDSDRCTVYFRSGDDHRQFASTWEALTRLSGITAGALR